MLHCCCHQVILGSSIDEALAWAQQAGNLPPSVAETVSQALAAKEQDFSSESLLFCVLHIGVTPEAVWWLHFCAGWQRASIPSGTFHHYFMTYDVCPTPLTF